MISRTTLVARLGFFGLVTVLDRMREITAVKASFRRSFSSLYFRLVAVFGDMSTTTVVASLRLGSTGSTCGTRRGKAVGGGVVQSSTGVASDDLAISTSADTGYSNPGRILVALCADMTCNSTIVARLCGSVCGAWGKSGSTASIGTIDYGVGAVSGEMATLLAVVAGGS